MNAPTHRPPHRQRGVALFVALVFLVVLTVLGVTALNNNTLQTRASAGAAQTNFAFQAAETGVTGGEAWLLTLTAPPPATCSAPCTDPTQVFPRYGLAAPVVTPTNLLDKTWFTANSRLFSSTQTLKDSYDSTTALPEQPRYVVEYYGYDLTSSIVITPGTTYKVYYYLVSGRGVGGQSSINTVTQSVVAKGF